MGKKNLLIVSLLVFTFMFAVQVSALDDLGSSKVNEVYEFCQVCDDASFITLSSIKTPTTNVLLNANMTSTGSGQFCYNYTPTEIGRYDFKGISDGCEGTFATYLEVTYTGTEFNIQHSYIYIIALVFLVLSIVGLWFIRSNISGEHSRNEQGSIVLINFKGFLRPILLGGIWILSLILLFIISNLGLAFLPNPMIGQLFFTFYKICFWITIIALPVSVIILIVKIVKSLELQKMIDRGLDIGGNNKL